MVSTIRIGSTETAVTFHNRSESDEMLLKTGKIDRNSTVFWKGQSSMKQSGARK